MPKHFPTRRSLLTAVPCFFLGRQLSGANEQSKAASNVDRLLDRIVATEAKVLKTISDRTPIVETYLQENLSTGSSAESRDNYFLGRMGLVNSIQYVSFLRRQSAPAPILETKTRSRFLVFKKTVSTEETPEHVEYLPAGFAQMVMIDASSFNRKTYKFDYIRREFLGDVRCLIFDVAPLRTGDPGRFVGRIWVEDQTYFIVRANGTYNKKVEDEMYFHFDSWRDNPSPGVWVPAITYIEDAVSLDEPETSAQSARPIRFKAQTRIWSYESPTHNRLEELTSILVEAGRNVKDDPGSKDLSPLEGQHRWEREAENNVLDRLERIGLIAPESEVEKVLDTVVNNLLVTNNLEVEARAKVLLTTPVETFTIGHTIVISRGLIDVLPDEASLALVLATELSHIALGHPTRTEYAFNDRTMVGDEVVLETFRFARTPEEVSAASTKAIALLLNSPYKDKMNNAGLFLKALQAHSGRLTNLIQSTLGNDLSRYIEMPEFQDLLAKAPALDEAKLEQIAALPLGSRVRVEPWDNQIHLMKAKPVALLSAREKMPFEIAPVSVYLTRANETAQGSAMRR
jgi:hypothetical protein